MLGKIHAAQQANVSWTRQLERNILQGDNRINDLRAIVRLQTRIRTCGFCQELQRPSRNESCFHRLKQESLESGRGKILFACYSLSDLAGESVGVVTLSESILSKRLNGVPGPPATVNQLRLRLTRIEETEIFDPHF